MQSGPTHNESIAVTVNGEPRRVAANETLQELMASLSLSQSERGVAVVRNGEVVSRGDWPHITLQADDELEIVRATVGG